jgi:ribonuclease R
MSKHKKPQRYLFEEVLAFMQHNDSKTFNYKQLSSAMEIYDEEERHELLETLEALRTQGFVIEKEKGRFQVKETENYATGTIDFTSQGTAFVIFSDTEPDIFIPARKSKDALQGDLVKVHLISRSHGKRKEGEVVEVIKRSKTEFVGTIRINPKFAFVIADSSKIHVDFFVRSSDINKALDGQKVLIRLKEWKPGEQNPSAMVLEVFGYPGEHKTEMHAIMAEYGFPESFPDDVEYAARKLPTEITREEIAKRRDFRKITTFTIDPVDAKDFDDALSIRKLDSGLWEIGVHIADVSHYLKPGTILDKEAVHRATSVYLVDRVVPMLPEVLSNFVCSLRPEEEKYCFSAVFQMDDDARIHDQWFGRTVIFSDRRFAYEEVQKIIETGEGDFNKEILVLDRLAKKLRDQRLKKGSIVFDKAEVKFHLDEEGNPLGVFFKTQQDAHKLIEDFMLLANKRVAEYLTGVGPDGAEPAARPKKGKENGGPAAVYRIHDVPNDEKIEELSGFAARFGHKMNIGNKQKISQAINKLLVDVKNKKEQGMIELLAVRSMPKAVYTTKNVGHYGLGFEHYTHFTSPIRRYPDVLVHRLLEARLDGRQYSNKDELELLCKHSSEMEKMAAEAERASVKFKQVEFMSDKIGEEFAGVITGVTEWGIYVEILENKCEGMVRSRDLKGDSFVYDEDNYRYVGRRTNKVFALGDTVRIVVMGADVIKKQLNFAFAGMEGDSPADRDSFSNESSGNGFGGQKRGGRSKSSWREKNDQAKGGKESRGKSGGKSSGKKEQRKKRR